MTFAEIKAKRDTMTPEQLACEAIWWGDERGGFISDVYVLPEEHINTGYGMTPKSTYEDDLDAVKLEVEARLPTGTPVFCTDDI